MFCLALKGSEIGDTAAKFGGKIAPSKEFAYARNAVYTGFCTVLGEGEGQGGGAAVFKNSVAVRPRSKTTAIIFVYEKINDSIM